MAAVLIEGGKLDEALKAAREGIPLRMEAGHASYDLDHLALRAALAGKEAAAARIIGYVDSFFAENDYARAPNEARASERVRALLRERLSPDEIERLRAEGAEKTEDEVCRLALEE